MLWLEAARFKMFYLLVLMSESVSVKMVWVVWNVVTAGAMSWDYWWFAYCQRLCQVGVACSSVCPCFPPCRNGALVVFSVHNE
jgi:hypothetical protein